MADILSEKTIKSIQIILKTYPQVVSCYLFGSYFSGKTHPKSDLDIGVVCIDKQGTSPIEIGTKIGESISNYQADVSFLDLNDSALVLIQIINGKLVYQKSLAERAALETRILHLYEDYRYFRRIHNHYLDKSFREGVYAG